MYTLSKAIAIVRRMDESSVRSSVFQSVYDSSRLIKVATDFYNLSPNAFKSVMLLIYGAKCFISVKASGNGRGKFLLMGAYPNDVKALTNLERCLPQNEVNWINLNIRNSINYTSIRKLVAYFAFSRRLYRFSRRLVIRHSFMPACRIFSTLVYYLKFKKELIERENVVIVIASHYGPESLALATAAHSCGCKVVITNHATSANRDALGMPVYADFLVCSGDAIKDVLHSEVKDAIEYCYFPLDLPSKKMKVPDVDANSIVIGIFLTALTNVEELNKLVSQLYRTEWCGQVRIRQHPAKIVNSDCESLVANFPDLVFTSHMPIHEDVSECDIAICGNSTVVVEILRGGKPVTYISTLDFLPQDYARFVYHGLLPEGSTNNAEQLLDITQAHYKNELWKYKMRYFDASYLKDENHLKEVCRVQMESIGSVDEEKITTSEEIFRKAG